MEIGLEVNKIYNCRFQDKIDIINDESIDMVLTDIPYELNKNTNLKAIKDHNKQSGSSGWQDPNDLYWDRDFDIDDYLKNCCRILKPSGSIIVWASWQQLGLVDDIIKKCLQGLKGEARIGIWKKTNPVIFNMDKMAIQPYELFVWNRKGSNAVFNNLNGKYINKENIRQHPEMHYYEIASPKVGATLEGKHPTAKPTSLFEWLILTYTNENEIIFDGCIGGGTTAVAAYKNKRKFIAFECEEEYCNLAEKRLEKLGLKKCVVKET
jgi:site-specific DNA-methyltransferase (adenine-specific)